VEAVRRLHARQVKVVMLTGDARAVAEAVDRELVGIDTVFAQALRRRKSPRSGICKNRACASRWWGTE
jgi:Cu2+-exporting ATPase